MIRSLLEIAVHELRHLYLAWAVRILDQLALEGRKNV
jgi:hypothetical protein